MTTFKQLTESIKPRNKTYWLDVTNHHIHPNDNEKDRLKHHNRDADNFVEKAKSHGLDARVHRYRNNGDHDDTLERGARISITHHDPSKVLDFVNKHYAVGKKMTPTDLYFHSMAQSSKKRI